VIDRKRTQVSRLKRSISCNFNKIQSNIAKNVHCQKKKKHKTKAHAHQAKKGAESTHIPTQFTNHSVYQ
jgi:hypothetical protein